MQTYIDNYLNEDKQIRLELDNLTTELHRALRSLNKARGWGSDESEKIKKVSRIEEQIREVTEQKLRLVREFEDALSKGF